MREITPDELRAADGRDGHPTWVAHAGQVYDVTGSSLWKGGVHEAQHAAGRDLTAELEDAPHGVEFVERFPMGGRLTTKGGST